MSGAFYNEHDPRAAAWLRELIKEGLIAPGVVDERDIQQITEADIAGFDQVHLFAGIGGWPLAFRLAGWPDDRPVWSGSCPCQPFSSGGKQKGTGDSRHLWPEMRRLVRVGRPAVMFGEQVASRLGRNWLAGVRADLEALAYAVGAADLCAAGVGAPHMRQRIFWVGREAEPRRVAGRLGHADVSRPQGQHQRRNRPDKRPSGTASVAGGWSDYDIVRCRDGKGRRFEPGALPLAHGVPGRVGLLRGYGNAIVPEVAAAFIRAAAQE